MKYLALASAIIASFVMTPAFAVGLTEADYEYLASQNVERGSPILRGLSPKEQARLHAHINDRTTVDHPAIRAKIVREVLAEHERNQHWEIMNPGQLWDSPKR